MVEPRSRRPPAPVPVAAGATPSSGEQGVANVDVPLNQVSTETPAVPSGSGKEPAPAGVCLLYCALLACDYDCSIMRCVYLPL